MTAPPDIRALAEAALEDDRRCAGGEWEADWRGTLGHASVNAKPKRSAPTDVLISIQHRGADIPPEAAWIAAARTREPELARAVLRLQAERDELARWKVAALAMVDEEDRENTFRDAVLDRLSGPPAAQVPLPIGGEGAG